MTLSRRQFLGAGMALGAAWLAQPLSAIAAAAKATTLAPGVTRVTLGKATITTLHDGFFARPLDDKFVRNVAFAEVQKALADAGLPIDKLDVPFTPVLVDIGNERVLFDCGNGEFGAATAGKLLENMAKAGIAPDSITAVVFSHFHGDHINGLRNKAGAVAFPKAKIFVPAPEWGFWMDDARMAAAPDAMKGNFNAVRRVFGPIADTLTRFEPGTELLPGLRSIAAFGHTPGHTAFTVDGGAQKLLYWADTTNVAALFVRNPDWAVMFDMDAEAARVTRRKLADMAIAEKMLVAGYHLPGSAIGTLATRGNGYEFTPLAG
ncbi:MAG: MBL fold metallo-hydrolase [Sulfuritalea sp.]|nr:MBL fold metallo-hydrolase [Sulfuritalea sp.]